MRLESPAGLRKFAEDPLLVANVNARPVVKHFQAHGTGAHALDEDCHTRCIHQPRRERLRAVRTAVHRKLDGVAHEVHQHVPPQQPIANDGQSRGAVQVEH